MIFSFLKWKIILSFSDYLDLYFALFYSRSILVVNEKPALEKPHFDGCTMVQKKRSETFQAFQNVLLVSTYVFFYIRFTLNAHI